MSFDLGPPRTHLLADGEYSVMITAAGSGYSRWRDLALTRWREDPTLDPYGFFVFLRDVDNGEVWSAGYQPVGREPEHYEVSFTEDRAQIRRKDGAILTSIEVIVSPEMSAEGRRISITNTARTTREIEVTTYAEVVLANPAADAAHPAFSKMFVQTDYAAEEGVLLATRRTRESGEPPAWMFHVSALDGEAVGALQFETDRARFLGRGRDVRSAVSIVDARPLSDTAGTVLDPVVSLRRRLRVAPGATARLDVWIGAAPTRAQALACAGTLRVMAAFDRAKALAAARAQAMLDELKISSDEALEFQRMASAVLYLDSASRAERDLLSRNRSGQPVLWACGISGDLPLVLVEIEGDGGLPSVERMLRAHAYWRSKRLAVDLVILNGAADAAELAGKLQAAAEASKVGGRAGGGAAVPGAAVAAAAVPGAVFLLRGDALPAASHELLRTAARLLIATQPDTAGRPADDGASHAGASHAGAAHAWAAGVSVTGGGPEPAAVGARPHLLNPPGRAEALGPLPALEFFNGLGGFAASGREYVTILQEGTWTPAPWSNVIANAQFGFLASADGTGTTWSINAQQNQLTPWSNDPVSNAPAEVVYLRDEDSGDLWSATPLPIREPTSSYVVRHGFGYSRFEHVSRGIASELLQFVPLDDSIKIARLSIVNRSSRRRRLSVTHYVDWVLGNQRSRSAPFIITETDAGSGALWARNPWSADFPDRVAFMDMGGRQQSCSGDRAEFLGRYGSLAEPKALLTAKARGSGLSGRVGGGLDPCGALQTVLHLEPGEPIDVVLLLGQGSTDDAARALVEKYRGADLDAALKAVTDFWDRTLGAVQVKTPDRSLDVLINGWLLYQTLVCRLWARTAFYQSSGAWGYRDQLQDVMALVIARPAIAREHILRAASRQFAAGDVQHWWLPVTDQGIQTRVSDDRIWLPYVVAHYLEVTEDFAVLEEQVAFLEGGPLEPGRQELFAAPKPTAAKQALYEHCALALDSSLSIGSHGLPLFGTGDWNDGMNRVGAAGRGESVWLGWFLHAALMRFAPIAERRGDGDKAALWRKQAFALQQAIEREAWDGDWYRRGYFDDGTALGSVSSDECRIDSVAQSWAVISGAAPREHALRAMAAVDAQLVSRSEGLVQLFTPPFDRTPRDPGYIKAYPPGLRENGGQYTHAAMWCTLAFALLGDGDRAGELFSLLNPVNHASTRTAIHRYKVEPYVVCADVYSAPAHIGRGGWTWYTGSAGWMYRTATEGILGIQVRGAVLRIDPCIPRAWPGFEITYKHGASRYQIAVENPRGVCRGIVRAALDGRDIPAAPCEIPLADDGSYHYARIVLG
jgi:cyclic beta-1,2-glucan synthetase